MSATEPSAEPGVIAGAVSLAATGEVDIATAGCLVAAADRALHDGAPGPTFVLDLGAVSFMDCAGLTALLTISASCGERGRSLVISNPPRCVLRILSITGLDRELTLC